jgi:cyanophycinase-like exopeptidase
MNHSLYVQTEGDQGPRKIKPKTSDRHDTLAAVPNNFVRTHKTKSLVSEANHKAKPLVNEVNILGEEELYVETDVAINEVRILDAAYRSAANSQEARIEL